MFALVLDPDYPGHVILEQFQAQVKGFFLIIIYCKEDILVYNIYIINIINHEVKFLSLLNELYY